MLQIQRLDLKHALAALRPRGGPVLRVQQALRGQLKMARLRQAEFGHAQG